MVKITEVHNKEECNRIEECMVRWLARDSERCNGPDHPDCPLVDVTEYEALRTKLDYAEADIDVGATVKKITDNETEATIIELEADFKKEKEEREDLEKQLNVYNKASKKLQEKLSGAKLAIGHLEKQLEEEREKIGRYKADHRLSIQTITKL